MKVLQINAVYGFASTGIIVKDIENLLINNGHTSYVAYQTAVNPPENSYRTGNKLDWKLHALYSRIMGKQAYASKLATKELINYIKKISPDIVHLHNLHSNYINLNMLCDYLAKAKLSTVITMHDCWYFTGKCTHYTAVKCDKWQTTCGNCPQNKNEQPSLFIDCTSMVLKDRTTRLNKINNLTFVGCSKWIADEAKKSLIKNAQIDVVYNGVDTSVFTPHESDFKEKNNLKDKFVILGMANKWCLEINKTAVEAIVRQNHDAKIIIVGCTDEQKDMFSQYENVLCIGYVNGRQELSDIYSSADVFINLTHADTLPTVNMESICCGTPVITYDCCGSPELVDDDSGFVIAEDDVAGLLCGIEQIKKTPITFDVKSKQEKFDKNTCYNKYLDIYNSLLKRNE
ncbi:MAG: glycosyltransferase [Clostridia bacterium]|nr:glycosyltransferase [Clostridia bacterium]